MNQSASNIFFTSLKSLIKSALSLCVIAFAWAMRLIGMVLTKFGEAIERIIIKRSSQ